MTAQFDWYAFADYSGAQSPAEQRTRIAWAVDRGCESVVWGEGLEAVVQKEQRSGSGSEAWGTGSGAVLQKEHRSENRWEVCGEGLEAAAQNEHRSGKKAGLDAAVEITCGDGEARPEPAVADGGKELLISDEETPFNRSGWRVTQGLTRQELMEAMLDLLREADRQGKRVMFGFDHNYGFPEGFHEAMFGGKPADWRQVLERYAGTVAGSEGEVGDALTKWSPRTWARTANEAMALSLGAANGPFWGTQFGGRPAQGLFGEYRLADGAGYAFRERRLVEERFRRLKPAYQIGGIGTVGQQSLYGILYLRELLRICGQEGIRVHVWPQDGCLLPEEGGCHVAAELYPTLCLEEEGVRGPRSDAGDAAATVQWMKRMDQEGKLAELMGARFSPAAWQRVRLEGWVLGVPASLADE